jgi:DNA-binding MarR family transcriptional regulator
MTTPERLTALRARSWLAVVAAYQACQRQYARLLGTFDLTIAQYDLLVAVHDAGGDATPALVAERLMVTRGNVSPLLRRVIERGWVRERPHPADGRSVLLSLTAPGAALLRRARAASSCFIAEQLSPFDDADVSRTLDQMQTMRAHLDAMDVEAVLRRARSASAAKAPSPRALPR